MLKNSSTIKRRYSKINSTDFKSLKKRPMSRIQSFKDRPANNRIPDQESEKSYLTQYVYHPESSLVVK